MPDAETDTDTDVLASLGIAGDVRPERHICTAPTCWGCRAPWMLWPRVNRETPLRHRVNGPRDE